MNVNSYASPALQLARPLPDGAALGAHVLACGRARGRAFALRCMGERLHDLVAPRLVTTIFAAAALLALAGCV
jgi:hypothetical protein